MKTPDWCSLPPELLLLILQKLIYNFADVIRAEAVCKSWRFISSEIRISPDSPPPQLPWLMVSFSSNRTLKSNYYSLSDNRQYTIPIDPVNWNEFCSGSSLGWFFMDNTSTSCCLLNPLRRVRIFLPSLRTLLPQGIEYDALFYVLCRENRGKLVRKGVLSCCPSSTSISNENCWIAMIVALDRYSPCLAVWKWGQPTWKLLSKRDSCEDVVYSKGKFYAVDGYGKIVVYDVGGPSLVVTIIRNPEPFKTEKNYVVESAGEILLVRRFRGWNDDLEMFRKTFKFRVFRKDEVHEKWVEVESLGGQSLFLGSNQSVSITASDYRGCKENCIYFTDDCFYDYAKGLTEPHDVGVFSLANECVEPLPGYSHDEHFTTHPPVWITPSPSMADGRLMTLDPSRLHPHLDSRIWSVEDPN